MPVSTSPQTIPLVPQDTELRGFETTADQKPEQQERMKRVFNRLTAMLEFKRPYEIQMERGFLLYDGISRLNPREAPIVEFSDVVQPWAAIFVETKTANEYSASSDYEFLPIDDENDVWKVELNMECVDHSRRKTFHQAKKLDGLRIKNICGVSIKRKGYRLIMRTLKVPTKEDEFGRMIEWEEKEVPWYDDLFEDLVDPLDFVVDPAATGMHDAVDCGQFHRMNWEDAFEMFGKDKRFDFDGIKPGLDNMVEFYENFNAPRDEWVIFAWPSTGARYTLDHSRYPASCKEVYFGPLPDEHKMLPFISEHCNASYITGFFFNGINRSPETGEETSHGENIVGHKVFWTPGVPVVLADLIDVRTSFGRQALEALKVAATNIIATEGSYRFNNKKKWKNGEQAIGMKGKFEIVNAAQAHVNDFEFHFNDYLQQMIMRVGVDPRNITDTKQKTLGQDQAERESAAIRLNAEIEYNEILSGVREGMIDYKLIQQHYTRMEIVRLTGKETDEELAKYDETRGEHPMTGGPLIGKRYRRIRTKRPMSETKAGQKNMLKREHQGKFSFPARREYILMSEVDIMIVPKWRAGQIRAILKQQASDDITLWTQVFPMTQANPKTGAQAAISVDDLPNFRRLVEKWVRADGGNIEKDIGNQNKKDPEEEKLDEAEQTLLKGHKPFSSIPDKGAAFNPANKVATPTPASNPLATPVQ